MGMIYKYDGPKKIKKYFQIDEETALWAMRMCVGEGSFGCSRKKVSAMLWSLANRYLLHPGSKHWDTFLYLMRRFSQPINPSWQRGGKKALQYKGTKHASEAKLMRREMICNLKHIDIPEHIQDAVYAFAEGKLFPPLELTDMQMSRISNWASLPSTPIKNPHGVDIAGDWFFEDADKTGKSILVDGCVVVRQVS